MAQSNDTSVLTINGGSSSIKFSLYATGETLTPLFSGEIDRVGTSDATLRYTNALTKQSEEIAVPSKESLATESFLLDWLEQQPHFSSIKAIGHRIVHGMQHTEPVLIDDGLLQELKSISAYDPDHMPAAIELIELCTERFPDRKQVACFDTAFHTTMPAVAKQFAIPRRFTDKGIQRYGFHGLSYAYLMEALTQEVGEKVAKGRVILAHLGSGASLAAVKEGKSIDTSMGFTPTAGIPMAKRSGDLDPGVAWYFMEIEKMDAATFNHVVNHESGLLGMSGSSADMQALLKARDSDPHAAQAVDVFCYQVKKYIGAFAAALGGVDVIVFSGGIGEHAALIRENVCKGLEFLGVVLDEAKNADHATVISGAESRVGVYVIKTNEEQMIAQLVCRVLNYPIK